MSQKLKEQIVSRLISEGCRNLSTEEIVRCLEGTIGSEMLIHETVKLISAGEITKSDITETEMEKAFAPETPEDLGKKCVGLVTEFDSMLKLGKQPEECQSELMRKHSLNAGQFLIALKTGIELVERSASR